MKRFKRILVYVPPLGESYRALERAVKVARHNHASLTVIDVARDKPVFFEGIIPEKTWTSVQDREDRLRIKTSWIEQEGLSFQTKVLHGRPTVEVVREVIRGQYDLLIKDVQVEGDDGPLFFGSVDMRLLRNCPCPVWLVKPKKDVPFERIMAAIDPQTSSIQGQAMNASIMELATSLAQTEAANLHVVSGWLGPGEMEVADSVASHVMRQYLEVAEDMARESLNTIIGASELDIPASRVYFRHGFSFDVITDVASDIDADLIIMGTLARTGVPGLLIGNTAEKVLRNVTRSVLTLKPAGFRSPIQLEDSLVG